MPDFVGGLPLHPLVVHFVVVLLPLAVLGSILTAVWPAVRRRFGWLAVAAAGAGTVLTPIATSSGDFLESRLGTNPGIQEHGRLGDMLFWWALPLFVAVTVLMVLHQRAEKAARAHAVDTADGGAGVTTETRRATGTSVVMLVMAVVTVGVAIGTAIHTYRVGDAGARLVWEFVEDQPPANGG
ncbi:DUF2231 domain-containing protein [Actinophytocola xanthii]|uniref:DUF2231 domain-containing protein n=1 Tax=Actinophytocola xanthii TaxID=1912961 RepID=A0A1Q8CKL0_9PSEU|nr:DUF2231 domain-containing protein [Actinophytocola xanthii]OLF14883.1 hypothetical protein BU204_24385 [Actinophytocola xanthii]